MGTAGLRNPLSMRVARSDRTRSVFPFLLLAGTLAVAAALDASSARASLCGVAGPACICEALGAAALCPGCGLTRGTALLLHGDVGRALQAHPAAPLVVCCAALGAALHAFVLVRGARAPWVERALGAGRALFAIGIVGAWLVRLLL